MLVEEEDVLAEAGQLARAEGVSPEHPEVADHLAAGLLAVAGDLRPPGQLVMQRPRLQRVAALELGPGGVSLVLLAGEQLPVIDSGPFPLGQLTVDPERILAGPRRRDLELVRSAMAVAAIEGVPVDLAGRQQFQAVQQAEAGQLAGLGSQPCGQCVGGRVTDEALQPLPGGDEGRAAGTGGRRQHPAGVMELGTDHVIPQLSQLGSRGDGGDLGPAPIAQLGVVGQIGRELLGIPAGLAQHVERHRGDRPEHGEPVRAYRRYLEIIGQPAEDLLGQGTEPVLVDPDDTGERHHHTDVQIDPAPDPAVADIRRDGRGRHRVGEEDLHHRPGRGRHHIRDGLPHIGVGPQEVTGAAVVPGVALDAGGDRPGLDDEQLVAGPAPFDVHRRLVEFGDPDSEGREL